MFDRARILCQDVDKDVRLVLASESIYKICLAINQEYIEIYMFEKVI